MSNIFDNPFNNPRNPENQERLDEPKMIFALLGVLIWFAVFISIFSVLKMIGGSSLAMLFAASVPASIVMYGGRFVQTPIFNIAVWLERRLRI